MNKKVVSVALAALFYVQTSFAGFDVHPDRVEDLGSRTLKRHQDIPQEFQQGGKYSTEWVWDQTQEDPQRESYYNWHLQGETQGFIGGIDVTDAKTAKLIGFPKQKVKVAVIDGGVNVDHEALLSYIYKNPMENGPGYLDGIDNDGNGLVDDYSGYNFVGFGAKDESLEVGRVYHSKNPTSKAIEEYGNAEYLYNSTYAALRGSADYLEKVLKRIGELYPDLEKKNHKTILTFVEEYRDEPLAQTWVDGADQFIYKHGDIYAYSNAYRALKNIASYLGVDPIDDTLSLQLIEDQWASDRIQSNMVWAREKNILVYQGYTAAKSNWNRYFDSSNITEKAEEAFKRIQNVGKIYGDTPIIMFADDYGDETKGTIAMLRDKAQTLKETFKSRFSSQSFANKLQAPRSPSTKDRSGHGTHVSGIIAGVVEAAFGKSDAPRAVEILPLSAVSGGDEKDRDVADAIRTAVDWGARVINMSFGKGYSPQKGLVDEAVKSAEAKGVIFVHAAGNESVGYMKFPVREYQDGGSYPYWINVGATGYIQENEGTTEGILNASFSNYGMGVDVLAPGVKIYASYSTGEKDEESPNTRYEYLQGTSMAAPVTSGVIAVLMALHPEKSTQEILDVLKHSSVRYDKERAYFRRPSYELDNVLALSGIYKNSYINNNSPNAGDFYKFAMPFGEIAQHGIINLKNALEYLAVEAPEVSED
ncbi:MAG: S8 family serine peptidase [Bdellovibrionales bacterium]|nr:S8 family serine peptidase [Bdellovibrionales bacterium]